MQPIQPIYLFADSQLLFWRNAEGLYLQNVRKLISTQSPKAAYVGASNGDNPQFYEIFVAAMESIGITDCKMISAFFDKEDHDFFERADIVLLAGGSVALGWKTFKAVGLDKAILKKYTEGGVLIGISAGAMQMGMSACSEDQTFQNNHFNTLQIIPFSIAAHQESNHWRDLKRLLLMPDSIANGIGIPFGGGFIFHPDFSIEPIRMPLIEMVVNSDNKQLVINTIYPENSGIIP